jgi:hypothetical protein
MILRFLFLFLKVMKDGLQEVPKGDKWSRRHLSFSGNFYLHLRDISVLRQYSKKL